MLTIQRLFNCFIVSQYKIYIGKHFSNIFLQLIGMVVIIYSSWEFAIIWQMYTLDICWWMDYITPFYAIGKYNKMYYITLMKALLLIPLTIMEIINEYRRFVVMSQHDKIVFNLKYCLYCGPIHHLSYNSCEEQNIKDKLLICKLRT